MHWMYTLITILTLLVVACSGAHTQRNLDRFRRAANGTPDNGTADNGTAECKFKFTLHPHYHIPSKYTVREPSAVTIDECKRICQSNVTCVAIEWRNTDLTCSALHDARKLGRRLNNTQYDLFEVDVRCPLPECLHSVRGYEYRGVKNTTISGRTCQSWSSQTPHGHNCAKLYENNYCRNPTLRAYCRGLSPWCYTTDPAMLFDYCGIPMCVTTGAVSAVATPDRSVTTGAVLAVTTPDNSVTNGAVIAVTTPDNSLTTGAVLDATTPTESVTTVHELADTTSNKTEADSGLTTETKVVIAAVAAGGAVVAGVGVAAIGAASTSAAATAGTTAVGAGANVLTGAEITGKIASAVAAKKTKKSVLGFFRKKLEDESETVEQKEEDEEDEEVLSLSSLYSYVMSMFSATSQTDEDSAVV